jgi:uncharacterized membrane protein
MNKSFKLIFLTSLVLNLLFLGVILGRVPHGFDAPPTRQQRMETALNKLPEPAQGRFRQILTQIRAAGDPLREPMDAARNQALQLMSAETFDEAAYDQQVKKFDELREEMFKRMSHVIKQVAKDLALDDRRTLADLLRRPPPRPEQN